MNMLFVRFLLVGGLNTAFGYGCFAIFLFFGLHYSVALFLSTVLGVVFNFKTTGVLVFKSSDNRLIFRFVMVYALVYGVNLAGLALFTSLGVVPYIGGAILVLPMALLAFLMQKKFVFSNV